MAHEFEDLGWPLHSERIGPPAKCHYCKAVLTAENDGGGITEQCVIDGHFARVDICEDCAEL